MQIQTFDPSHVRIAAELLADRWRRRLTTFPLLGDTYATSEACLPLIEERLEEGATGAIAVQDEVVVGYFLAVPGEGERGRHIWAGPECHAVQEGLADEVIRPLYAHVSKPWVDEGRIHHYVIAPADDLAEMEAWLNLAFARESALAVRKTSRIEAGDEQVEVRLATLEDLDLARPLFTQIPDAHRAAPVFAYIEDEFYENLEPGHSELLRDPDVGYWIALHEGTAVGYAVMRPVKAEDASMVKPPGTVELLIAGTSGATRRKGVMRAVITEAMKWCARNGYPACVTDWRVANLDSSRAWPRFGFETTAYRLHRIIDPRVIDQRTYRRVTR